MMAVPISPSNREVIRNGPYEQAEILLASLLAGGLDKSSMGELGIDLFRSERFSLAMMLFAAWTELEPLNPEPWSNLGLCLSRNGQLREARAVLEHACAVKPGYAPALNNLCMVYQFLGEHDLQLANATEALRLQPASSLAYNNLGTALMDEGRLVEAKQAFETSRSIDPTNFEAGFNLARVAADEGRNEEAQVFLEAALDGPAGKDRRLRDMIEYHLSYVYLATGKLAKGWDFYERGFASSISPKIARTPDRRFSVPRWRGQRLSRGQRLMIWREQGIGDEIRFLALLPLLDAGDGHLIIETEPRLVGMLRRSFPHAMVRVQQIADVGADVRAEHDYDFHLPAGSLPSLLMQSTDVYDRLGSYLKASSQETSRFAQRLAGHERKIKVGICWRSHQLSANRNRKYTALAEWHEVLAKPNCVFVNLQYGECEAELQAMETALGIQILRWSDVNLKDDLDAVLGIMDNLDLVISPSTAVLPFAGALGKPTIYLGQRSWILLGESDRYPWFRSVRPLIVPPTDPVSSTLPEVPRWIDQTVLFR